MRVAALTLAFVLIAPSLFIIGEAQHDCSGDGCEICQTLSTAAAITHTGADVPSPVALAAPAFGLALLCAAPCDRAAAQTLVGLKVRLDC